LVKGAAQRALQKARNEPTPDPVAQQEVADFNRKLEDLTPSAFVSYGLIAINLAIFVFMLFGGVSWDKPTTADLLGWGAEFGPRTLHGQWWRLLTSMFVHIGMMHVVYNMLAFAYAGPMVERMFGNVGFLALYLISGIGGGLLALFTDAMVVHAGASGAVFGVYGALLAQIVKQGRTMPPHVTAQLRAIGLAFVIYNLVNSLRPGISMAAHLGGLATGFLCGLLLAKPLTHDAQEERSGGAIMVLGLGAVLLLGGVVGAQARYPRLDRLQELQSRFALLDKQDTKAFNGVRYESDRQGMNDQAFADYVERSVLPEWSALREEIEAYQAEAPRPFIGRVRIIAEYMRLRQQSCELIVSGLRKHDQHDIDDAQELRDRARNQRWQ
jgi:rhomboid protease GluP